MVFWKIEQCLGMSARIAEMSAGHRDRTKNRPKPDRHRHPLSPAV